MADVSVLESGIDISKLKVPDLKRELKSRGLNTSGNKTDLIERLQSALKANERTSNESVDDLDEDLLNEDDDDVHLETTESVISDIDTALNDSLAPKGQKRKSDENGTKQEKTAPKKVVLNRNTPLIENTRISTESKEGSVKSNGSTEEKRVVKLSGLSAKERLEMRAKKFDVSLSNEAKKVARAERFGTANPTNSAQTKNTSIDVLKQRAERFGGSVSTAMVSLDQQQRLEKRKERFGIVTPEDKAKQRLERFKQPVK
ncbi:SAP domain-containing ribonucleoprotein-like Protein [Tribolium castaneum]|uniref:SAP domain-containing ribonucleoprotein-like Protein n=1 Tax=Tribolium castaneum TaxID=7070 RepID=D6WM78_TRICA|nr:SAP domain-containing ribonucleoprotein-like Protein [Tribolium castaneum]